MLSVPADVPAWQVGPRGFHQMSSMTTVWGVPWVGVPGVGAT